MLLPRGAYPGTGKHYWVVSVQKNENKYTRRSVQCQVNRLPRRARFLDLFAGTGSVGIEALSRGAAQATFIEMNHSVLKLVRENLKITGLGDRAETLQADAFKFLQSNAAQNGNAQRVYDMIYVAPPQYHEMAARALAMLDSSPLLAEDGLVIVQIHPKERSVVATVPLTHLVLSDERKYGSTLLMFYERVSGQDDGN